MWLKSLKCACDCPHNIDEFARRKICKENTASNTSVTASLVRPHDVHVNNNVFRAEFRFATPIGTARTAFADAAVLRIPGILSLPSCCLFQFRAGMSRALNNYCRAGRIQAPVLVRCLADLANWCGVHAAIQFILITRTEEREHMQLASSDHCETTILFPVSMLANGQINEERILRSVENSTSWSFPGTSTLVWRRFLGCWCCCVKTSRNPVATRNHVACSSSEQEWAEHWTTIAVPEEYKHLC